MPYRDDGVGYQNTDTSRAAAPSAVKGLHLDVLAMLDIRGPQTADELAKLIGEDTLSIRPRLTELKNMGLVVDTGLRRQSDRGRQAIVWGLKP